MRYLTEGLVAGGLVAGVVWYATRDRDRAARERANAERLARLADARAQLAAAIALADGAVVAGNAARPTPVSPSAQPPRDKTAGISRRFDELFARHGRGIPAAYLRALAQAESGMNPADRLGLINVVPIALSDYNERHPEARISPEDMRDPAKNITVAADHLRVIIDGFRRHHPDVPNLAENWQNPRFAELLTAAWNAGHSERAGVGRVVRLLKAQPAASRPNEITIDAVFDAAVRAQATSHLSNPRKLAYAKGVAAAFFREVERDERDGIRVTAA